MSSSLKKQALHGAFWSFTERFGQQGIQFVVSIIIARLLEPRDFGILGMLALFMALAQSVIDSGFGQALIQKQDADHTDESTIFWFNLMTGVAMAGILFMAAPWIAAFYDTPLLQPITRVFCLNLVINSFSIVQNALLMKELAFKQRMIPVLSSILVSGVVGVTLAWMGFGVWSLVLQGLVGNIVRTAGLWMVHSWRPSFSFSRDSFRTLWGFGSKMLYSGLLNTFFQNIYLVIIGKLYSAGQLGFYERSKKLMMLSSQSLSQVVSQVSFPILSKMQGDAVRMRHGFTKALQITILAVVPMMVGLGIVAPDFIRVLLGEKWMPCVPYLQIMCVSYAIYPLHLLNVHVVLALGRSDLFFKLEVMKKALTIISILVTYRYGVCGLLWGQVVGSYVCLLINAHYVQRLLGYGLVAQLAGVRKILLASLGMGLCVWLARGLPFELAVVRLTVQSVAGIAVFGLLEYLLREPVFIEYSTALKSRVLNLSVVISQHSK